MNKIEPGQVFRVSAEKRTPRENESFVTLDGGTIGTSEHNWGHGDRYILEPIDPARVTIADEATPTGPKWKVDKGTGGFWVKTQTETGTQHGGFFGEKTFPDAEQRARALCDELNERDKPKPRYEVRQNEIGCYVWSQPRNAAVVFADHIGGNHQLADELCAVFNKHAKD